MSSKDSRAAQIVKDGEQATKQEQQAESPEDDHGKHDDPTQAELLIQQPELLIDLLEEEIQHDLSDPVLKVLAEDEEFQRTLDAVCQRAVFRRSSSYSWEDLRQDVWIKFGRWLGHYRYEASFKTVLWRIARNQLVDVHRQAGQECCSLEDLLPDEYDTQIDLPSPTALTDIQDNIQVSEWLATLDEDERELYVQHQHFGVSLTEVARARDVSRQAVSKQWQRVLKKLAPLVRDRR
jgi:RNA polymerase sigma-70 factor (ECF subfamily)